MTDDLVSKVVSESINEARILALRSFLPYGMWTTSKGREVLFNRAYKPIWQRQDDLVEIADSREWVKDITNEEWFFDDLTAPWETWRGCRKSFLLCIKILKDWGVFGNNSEHKLIGPERAPLNARKEV